MQQERCHCVNLVDLVKNFLWSLYYLFAKIGFDTAGPLRYLQFLRIVRFTSQPVSRHLPATFIPEDLRGLTDRPTERKRASERCSGVDH